MTIRNKALVFAGVLLVLIFAGIRPTIVWNQEAPAKAVPATVLSDNEGEAPKVVDTDAAPAAMTPAPPQPAPTVLSDGPAEPKAEPAPAPAESAPTPAPASAPTVPLAPIEPTFTDGDQGSTPTPTATPAPTPAPAAAPTPQGTSVPVEAAAKPVTRRSRHQQAAVTPAVPAPVAASNDSKDYVQPNPVVVTQVAFYRGEVAKLERKLAQCKGNHVRTKRLRSMIREAKRRCKTPVKSAPARRSAPKPAPAPAKPVSNSAAAAAASAVVNINNPTAYEYAVLTPGALAPGVIMPAAIPVVPVAPGVINVPVTTYVPYAPVAPAAPIAWGWYVLAAVVALAALYIWSNRRRPGLPVPAHLRNLADASHGNLVLDMSDIAHRSNFSAWSDADGRTMWDFNHSTSRSEAIRPTPPPPPH